MKVSTVTITGADDNTSIYEMLDIQKEFPFVEWGILFSKSKRGSPRYPSPATAEKLTILPSLRLSAHLCGEFSKEIIQERDYAFLDVLPKEFSRVQINYNFSRDSISSKMGLEGLLKYAENNRKLSPEPDRRFILQWNEANKGVLSEFILHNDLWAYFDFLYDESGGRGTKIVDLIPPLIHKTGYAGGIGPDNIHEVLLAIRDIETKVATECWIDMESGVRDGEILSMEKVREVLEVVRDSHCQGDSPYS